MLTRFFVFCLGIAVDRTVHKVMKRARTMSTGATTDAKAESSSAMKDAFAKYAQYLNDLVCEQHPLFLWIR